MTREEAIEKLELMRQKVDEETYRALILAIKALENHDTFMKRAYEQGKQDALSQEPTTTTNNNEPITIIYPTIVCDDTISRDAVMNEVKCWIGSGEYRYTNATDYLSKRIRDLPPVKPQYKECRTLDEFIKEQTE